MQIAKKPKYILVEKCRDGVTRTYFRRGKGRRLRMPDLGTPEFDKQYAIVMKYDGDIDEMLRDGTCKECDALLRTAVARAKSRKRAKELPFDITADWAVNEMRKQGYTCALTGIQFSTDKPENAYMRPFAPSLDRIEPAKGYVVGNVRIFIFGINVMLSDWGEPVFKRIATAYAHKKNGNSLTATQIPSLNIYLSEYNNLADVESKMATPAGQQQANIFNAIAKS